MGTANFWSHENGIFLVEGYTYEDVRKHFIEDEGMCEDDITDEMIQSEMDFQNEFHYRDYMREFMAYTLEDNGYEVVVENDFEAMVYNKGMKVVAKLILKSGYYDGVQLIVETDPENIVPDYYYFNTVKELHEEYTPHHKNLLKLISKLTTPLTITARFSNGETWYQKAS